jgi:hypothetical protein
VSGPASAGVEGSPGHHRRHRRGSQPIRGGPRVRDLPGLDLAPGEALPAAGRGRVRAPLTPPAHQPNPVTPSHHRPDHRAAGETSQQRPRPRPPHHRLASATPPPLDGLAGVHPPPPTRRRAGRTHTAEATQILLHPVCRRTTQRTLASRLHPLVARRRHPRRNPELDRRPRPLRSLGHRPPPRHRTNRPRIVPQSLCRPRHSSFHPDRQRHGVHHPPVRRQGWAQRPRTNYAAWA